MLEAILTDPLAPTPNTWFRHLPNRPDLVAPFAGRIFAALGQLQGADRRGGSNGHALWRLVAILPDPALAPHRSRMIEWMKPGAIREWTSETWQLFTRLDVTDPVERELVLARFERPGELSTQLFDGFCRMGVAAPPDAKQRLLAIWTNRGAAADASKSDRGRDEVKLYLALARMGLKQQAGQVEQRYMGTAFAGIWNQITPETGDDVCGLSDNDLWNRLRKR